MDQATLWRICHKKFIKSAFSGEGARLFGGRFNSEGKAAVYTAGSHSLALLETLVRTKNRDYFQECAVFKAEIPEHSIYKPGLNELPEGWNDLPHGMKSQQFGDEWLTSGLHLAMRLPSVVVPVEYNVVLNPQHPDFPHIKITETEGIPFDSRLFS
ncbi:MAG: RES family NAD+ phosphorylase [Balneolaceae bacterium]|nr:RES family NAD+ phosphorylase [Balneolaceae bacterium]